MSRIIIFLSIILTLSACSSTPRLIRPNLKPEIPVEVLNKNGIVGYNANYKRGYFRLLPYFFYNEKNTFNGIRGDFYNVDYQSGSYLNIMPCFYSEYGKYKNALVVLIDMTYSSKLELKDILISVESSKNGKFVKGNLTNNEISKKQQRVLFVKELELQNKYDILNKIDDDVITVRIGEQTYTFLNPEIELNLEQN